MEKYIYDEKNGLHYELIDDYYYPCLTVPESPSVGIWGMHRLKYLRENKRVLYQVLLYTDKLKSHLEEVDNNAEEMFTQLVKQLSVEECVTEDIKATDQMMWVSKMNNIYNRAKDIVCNELIFG